MRIALDAMGGDLAPKATVEGAVAAARDFGIEIVLVGDLDPGDARGNRTQDRRSQNNRRARARERRDGRVADGVGAYQAALLDSRRPRDGQARRRERVRQRRQLGRRDGGGNDDSWHFARSRPPRDRFAGARQRWLRAVDRRRRQHRRQTGQPRAIRRDGQRVLPIACAECPTPASVSWPTAKRSPRATT